MLVHNVFFWLKPSCTAEQKEKFDKGVKSLLKINSVKIGKVGIPSATDRPVIDRSYSYHLLTIFDNMEGHDSYQVDPMHKKFLEDCSSFWEKVIIYDSDEV